jgi:Cu/Ag efflux pump CusA
MLQPLAITLIGGLLISMLLPLLVTQVSFFRVTRKRPQQQMREAAV